MAAGDRHVMEVLPATCTRTKLILEASDPQKQGHKQENGTEIAQSSGGSLHLLMGHGLRTR